MQIKRACTKIQAVHICMYQCSNTYRYIQIIPALSACISESIHANKMCRFRGAVADAPGQLGQLQHAESAKTGHENASKRIYERGSILWAFPAEESEERFRGIGRVLRAGVRKIKCWRSAPHSASACSSGGGGGARALRLGASVMQYISPVAPPRFCLWGAGVGGREGVATRRGATCCPAACAFYPL
jgi:hypothetical protein